MSVPGDSTKLLDAHGAALLLFARQFVTGRADAEDIVQEAFLCYWRSRHRAHDAVAYLFACVRGCALEWRRSGQRRTRRESRQEVFPPGSSLFSCAVEADEWRARVESMLAELPDEQRQVVVMKVWGGLSFPQVAAALDISANTAASRYRYAIQKLRQTLAREKAT